MIIRISDILEAWEAKVADLNENRRQLKKEYSIMSQGRINADSKAVILESKAIISGGRLWEKNGKRRVYFNDLEVIYGLEIIRYESGRISSAKLDGEKISNSEAGRMISNFGRIWLEDGKIFQSGFNELRRSEVDVDWLVKEIEKRIKEVA